MNTKPKTLVLYANGFRKIDQITNTFIRGILGVNYDYKPPSLLKKISSLNTIVNYVLNPYVFLSYVNDWREAFASSPQLKVDMCNLFDFFERRKFLEKIPEYDLVILLHSATGDSMKLLTKHTEDFVKRKGKLLTFIGNEYDLMEEKIHFITNTNADYVASQLPFLTAKWLYSDCPTTVLAVPHALNASVYKSQQSLESRSVDFVFRGAHYPLFIGDTERNDFFKFFVNRTNNTHGLKLDIKIGARINLPRHDWVSLLNQGKGVPGAEAGSLFLDKKGLIISQAKKYLIGNPDTTLDILFDKFFKNPEVEYRCGKSISSRHFEPIGTKTCQVLVEGDYNGILKPNEHYIPIKKDYSNFDEAMYKFKDDGFRTNMVHRTLEYTLDEHTYDIRVAKLVEQIL